jgi:hypothetical protein
MESQVIEGTAVAISEPQAQLAEWTPRFAVAVDEAIERKREKRRFFQEVMEADLHYGVIPGTGSKPALLKPGAEMLLSNMGLNQEFSDAEPPRIDYDGTGAGNGEPLIVYRRVCCIYRQTGALEHERMLVARAEGLCSSREEKYRWRNASRVCPACGKGAIIKGKAEYDGGWVCFKKKDGCGAKFSDGDPAIESQDSGKVPNPNVAEQENTILKMADKRALVAATLLATGCSDIFTQDVEDSVDEAPPAKPPAPKPTARDDDTPENRARGIKAVHSLAREHGIDLDAPDSPYRKLLLSDPAFAYHFEDAAVEVSSKALTYGELRRFYAALKDYVKAGAA